MRHADPELRAALIQRLTEPEPSERVGVQLALALARIMRSEANRGQAAVLEGFAEALRRSSLPGHALLALLHTGKERRSMCVAGRGGGVGRYMRLPSSSQDWRILQRKEHLQELPHRLLPN